MPIVEVLGGAQGGIEVVVIEGWVEDLMSGVLEVGRFGTTNHAMPAVKK